uniref:Endoribonuclease n=1 Tax=Haemonchus contortus TaxID=6289 RepID=A0A7I4XRV7_HAECO
MLRLVLLAVTFGQVAFAGESIPPFRVANEELLALSRKLNELDENGAHRQQIKVNFQGHTTPGDTRDNAPERLISGVDPFLFTKPTYKLLMVLFDNFHREAGRPEPRVSRQEDAQESLAFLTAVLQSKVMQEVYGFLNRKNHPFARNPNLFGTWMYQLWFGRYSRARGVLDSSAFEHIFVGEEKNGEVSGLHNWVRFFTLENNATERFDYQGFIVKRGGVMTTIRFNWKGLPKKSGSLMIGTSPEFDMALYTMCFLSRRGKEPCQVEVNGCPVSVTSYDLIQNGKAYIGTVYPTAGPQSDRCGRF